MAAIKQLAVVARSGTGKGAAAPFVAKAAFQASFTAAARSPSRFRSISGS